MDRINTTLKEILNAIRTQLINRGVFKIDEVFISLSDELPLYAPSGVYGIITPLQHFPTQSIINGAGNNVFHFFGNIQITIWSSNHTDESSRDERWLVNSSRGTFTKLKQIQLALHMADFQKSGGYILEEPMRMLYALEPERIDNKLWAKTQIVYEVAYRISAGSCGNGC